MGGGDRKGGGERCSARLVHLSTPGGKIEPAHPHPREEGVPPLLSSEITVIRDICLNGIITRFRDRRGNTCN